MRWCCVPGHLGIGLISSRAEHKNIGDGCQRFHAAGKVDRLGHFTPSWTALVFAYLTSTEHRRKSSI